MNQTNRLTRDALTMVELIGVVAILSVVALLLLPATIRHLDRLAAERELVTLRSLGDALEASVMRNSYIPSFTNWHVMVSGQSGMLPAEVTTNPRRNARVLLVDGGGWLNTNLPYAQTQAGSSNFPARARMMIVSSMRGALPISSGIVTGSDFEALWAAAPGTLPAVAPWTAWGGDADDVKVHRVNLSPLFVRLALSTYVSGTNGQYAVANGTTNQVVRNSPVISHFLKGTQLRLFTGPPASKFDGAQILTEDRSLVFEQGTWRDSVLGRLVTGVGDGSGIVAAFLAAPPNTNSKLSRLSGSLGNTQQVEVVETMINYLSNYSAWSSNGFASGSLQTHLQTVVQPALMDAVLGLYSGAGQYNNYPTNGAPCN